MKKTIKFTAAVAMIGLMAFASAGCGGDDKKAAAAKDTLKFGVTNFADSLEPTDNYFGWIVMRYGLGECLRITVGTEAENQRLLAALDEVMK